MKGKQQKQQQSSNINTLYIISKGRPDCITASTLCSIGYKGEWFIVCGDNDETIPSYIEKWGEDRILVFDWKKETESIDFLDNFGCDNMPSGCCPARNAVRKFSKARGEKRHWMFDDDYNCFYWYNIYTKKWIKMTGEFMYNKLLMLAQLADEACLFNIGIALAADAHPSSVLKLGRRVFNMHNLSNEDGMFTPWRSRMNEDLINAIETFKRGKNEYFVKSYMVTMAPTQKLSGGMTDIYLNEGTIRKSAYAILYDPHNVKLVIKHGRYHHAVNWRNVVPKLLNERYASV